MAASKRKSAVKAVKKTAKTRKLRAAAKNKVARPAAVSPAVAQLDERIAILRSNLRELTEQAAASSGASTEELLSQRIGAQEAKLQVLIKQRDELARRGS